MQFLTLSLLLCISLSFICAVVIGEFLVRMQFPLPSPNKRIGRIDALRGCPALSVFLHHFIAWIQVDRLGGSFATYPAPFFKSMGSGGVSLFFMITGLVFYPRILAGFGTVRFTSIIVGRVFRIMPLVITSVLAVTAIIRLRTGNAFDTDFIFAFTSWITAYGEPPLLGYADSWMLNSNVLWSLWYEWIFYLVIMPVSALAIAGIRGHLPSWCVPVAILIVPMLLLAAGIRVAILYFLPLFAIGMLSHECRSNQRAAVFLKTRLAAAIAIASLVVAMSVSWSALPVYPFYAFLFAAIVCDNDLLGLLKSRALLALGECSFSIYLLHGLVLNLLFVDGNPLLRPIATEWLPVLMPAVTASVVLVAAVSFMVIERPAMRIGTALSKRMTGIRPPISAPSQQVAP